MIFGVLLLIFGVILLLSNLGLITGGVWSTFWDIFWPSVIIVMAVNLLIPKKIRKDRSGRICYWCPFGKSSEEKIEKSQEKE